MTLKIDITTQQIGARVPGIENAIIQAEADANELIERLKRSAA